MLANNRCIFECRKFSPNIFNKNKCTLCFGKREEHNPAALDYNRVSSRLTQIKAQETSRDSIVVITRIKKEASREEGKKTD